MRKRTVRKGKAEKVTIYFKDYAAANSRSYSDQELSEICSKILADRRKRRFVRVNKR